jgi:transposase-like protein
MADEVRQVGISELTFYKWRKQWGRMSHDQLRHLTELQERTSGSQGGGRPNARRQRRMSSDEGLTVAPSRSGALVEQGHSGTSKL